MSGPTLSVVMPNYNHSRYLAEAILGIATQSRPPDEFVVLDDASTDDSVRVIESFLDRFSFLRLIRLERNVGVLAAIRRLQAEVHGDYLFCAAAEMIIPGSSYWNLGFGREIGQVEEDAEGKRTMVTLGGNMAWLMQKLAG